jgi:hypothetical protein
MSWRQYWNDDNPIYVNQRHQQLHCSRIADDTLRLVDELCQEPRSASVLDFGCGRALDAARVAQRCGRRACWTICVSASPASTTSRS